MSRSDPVPKKGKGLLYPTDSDDNFLVGSNWLSKYTRQGSRVLRVKLVNNSIVLPDRLSSLNKMSQESYEAQILATRGGTKPQTWGKQSSAFEFNAYGVECYNFCVAMTHHCQSPQPGRLTCLMKSYIPVACEIQNFGHPIAVVAERAAYLIVFQARQHPMSNKPLIHGDLTLTTTDYYCDRGIGNEELLVEGTLIKVPEDEALVEGVVDVVKGSDGCSAFEAKVDFKKKDSGKLAFTCQVVFYTSAYEEQLWFKI